MNLKERIGKEIKLVVGKTSHVFSWQEWIRMSSDFLEVDPKYRTNQLSKENGRYYLITGEEAYPRYKAYNNIDNWLPYVDKMLRNHKVEILKYSFIYVWDTKEEKLIEAYTKIQGNEINLHDELKEYCTWIPKN